MSDRDHIEQDDLDEQEAELLPERTAMSLITTPGDGGILPDSPLDLVPPPTAE
jgi:hypothetical protein